MHLVLIGGSLRPESLNLRFLQYLAVQLETDGHRIERVSGEGLRLPLYQDGLPTPPAVSTLLDLLRAAEGTILVSPEYNAGIPGHLKNAVDWISVQKPNPFRGMPVLLCACSPGALGGARALVPWRATLANLGAFAVPEAITVPHADQNLDPSGAPTDPRTREFVRSALASFLSVAGKLKGVPA